MDAERRLGGSGREVRARITFLDGPVDAPAVQGGPVGVGIELLRDVDAGSAPFATGEQLEAEDRVEAGLPADGLEAEVRPRLLADSLLVEVDLARRALLATDHPRAHDRPPLHPLADLGR